MSRRANRKKQDETTFGSVWSFGFFLATLSNLMLCPLVYMLLLVSPERKVLATQVLTAYGFGLVAAGLIVSTSKISRLRTIIHELKHAVLVVLTGNKLNNFVADKHEGYVEYKMYENKLHFAPLIKLAPYFFPLFSLPMIIAFMVLDSFFPVQCAVLLGIALASDICFGVEEIHPFQTDFKKLFGGFIISKIYLVGFYLLWPAVLTLWVRSGPEGILDGSAILAEIILRRIG